MPVLDISDKFAAACSPVIDSNYDTCGSITRASIDHLSVTDLNALFTPGGLFADLDAWFFHSIEMKACGVVRNIWYDWIYANADRTLYKGALSGTKAVRGPSLMHPFIMGNQRSVVNRDYWQVTAGFANSAYTADVTGPLTAPQKALGVAGDRIVRIISPGGVPTDPNFFRDRDRIHIFSKSATGDSEHGQWKVLAAAANAGMTEVDVLVTDENSGSAELFDATPEDGVIIIGINNVNDYEVWCQNLPTLDPRKKVPFWVQTWRNARCVDSEYLKVFQRLMVANPAFKEFGDLPLAERNAQDEMEAQRRFVNAFFLNKPISANQTLTLWEDLESINTTDGADFTVGIGGKLIAKRANFVGVKEQLRVCDRVIDMAGTPLNIYTFLQYNYDIMRARKTNGRKVTDIDWWTNSTMRAHIQTAFMQYYKDQYLDQLRIVVKINEINEQLGIVYDSYLAKRPGGIRINIMSHDMFDDWQEAHVDAGQDPVGNVLLALDIGKPGAGTIYYAQVATNRRSSTTADINQLARLDRSFRCVMEIVSQEQTLTSETGTVVVECPLNSLWLENIALEPFDTSTTTTTTTTTTSTTGA